MLVLVVPLAFGAALANETLSGDEAEELPGRSFPARLGVFAIGAVFLAAPIAPTDEVAVLATGLDWVSVAAVLGCSLVVGYLVLYTLEFRGQSERLGDTSPLRRVGHACTLYAVSLLVAAGLLLALGDAATEAFSTQVRWSVVLAFPASIGASAARVVVT
jgi:uncharacterized membrane protein